MVAAGMYGRRRSSMSAPQLRILSTTRLSSLRSRDAENSLKCRPSMRLRTASLETAAICSFYQHSKPNKTTLDIRSKHTVAGRETLGAEETMTSVGRSLV